jgi:hypothetical protein
MPADEELLPDGSAQKTICDTPVAQRTGSWICGSANSVSPLTPLDPADTFAQRTPQSTWCLQNVAACWRVYSATEANFDAGLDYGCGSVMVGHVSIEFDTTLNGAQAIDKPVKIQNSVGVTNLVVEGNRLYYSPAHPEGNTEDRGYFFAHLAFQNPQQAFVWYHWGPNGYKSFDKFKVHTGSVVHIWSWTQGATHDCPATKMYVRVKGNQFFRQSDNRTYYFHAASTLGRKPFEMKPL